MKRIVLVIVILIALNGNPAQAAPVEWLLHLNPDRAATPDRVFRDHQLIALRHIPRIDVWVVTARSGAAPLASIRTDPAVDWIEANGWVRASDVITPDDTFYVAQQWPYLNVMRVPEA